MGKALSLVSSLKARALERQSFKMPSVLFKNMWEQEFLQLPGYQAVELELSESIVLNSRLYTG